MRAGPGQVLDPSCQRQDFAGVTDKANFDFDYDNDYDYDNDNDNDNDNENDNDNDYPQH